MHPVTAREMFVGRYVDFQEGWLVFESDTERRRLAPYPVQWADFPVMELETLLNMATPSPSRLRGESSGAFRRVEERGTSAENAAAAPPTAAATSTGAAATTPVAPVAVEPRTVGEWREFVGPSGRRWTVTLANRVGGAGTDFGPGGRRLLRFAADDGTVCDLEAWPDDWQRFTSAQLMELLRRAEPSRDAAGRAPRRRREDREP
jgi:hypothetical protein